MPDRSCIVCELSSDGSDGAKKKKKKKKRKKDQVFFLKHWPGYHNKPEILPAGRVGRLPAFYLRVLPSTCGLTTRGRSTRTRPSAVKSNGVSKRSRRVGNARSRPAKGAWDPATGDNAQAKVRLWRGKVGAGGTGREGFGTYPRGFALILPVARAPRKFLPAVENSFSQPPRLPRSLTPLPSGGPDSLRGIFFFFFFFFVRGDCVGTH